MKDKLHWLIYHKDSPLTNHELSFGCEVLHDGNVVRVCEDPVESLIYVEDGLVAKYEVEILGHPIRVGDVLHAIEFHKCKGNLMYDSFSRLGQAWQDLIPKKRRQEGETALNRSLQDLFFSEGVEWIKGPIGYRTYEEREWILEDSNLRALGELLIELFYPSNH